MWEVLKTPRALSALEAPDWTRLTAGCTQTEQTDVTESVLWQEEGYTGKYSLSPRAEPEGFFEVAYDAVIAVTANIDAAVPI